MNDKEKAFVGLGPTPLPWSNVVSDEDVSARAKAARQAALAKGAKHEMKATKFDTGKLMYDLMPPMTFREVIAVFTFGAFKYGRFNWLYEGGWPFLRPMAAAMRHIEKWRDGEILDPESGLGHLTHAAVCLLMLRTYELIGRKDDSEWEELRRTIRAGNVKEFRPTDSTLVGPSEEIGSVPIAASKKRRPKSVRGARGSRPKNKRKRGV